MSTYIFQKISKDGMNAGITRGTIDSRDWLRDRASQITSVNTTMLMKDNANMYSKLSDMDIGRMFMFFYDPKHKKTLPYYDRFPLVFVIDRKQDGFLGLNLHYLPHLYRARLMDALYSIERMDNIRQTKKLKLTYELLRSASKFRYFKPCLKQYLTQHRRSRFLYIPYDEWDVALMLPTERFMKDNKQNVWNESKRIILGN